jgi:cobalamin biosynthesis protein CobD/CbiB
MAAMAGALGVTLEKRGAYRLGEGPGPAPADIGRAVRVVAAAAALVISAAALCLWSRGAR